MVLVFLVELHAIDNQFRKAWMPFLCRGDKGSADLDSFRAVAEELTPLLDEIQLPPLSGDMLFDVVQKKKPTAGSLDSWGWREFKALPVTWFDKLASIITLVEEEGVWPEGLFDAHIAIRTWGHGDLLPPDQETGAERFRLYLSVPKPSSDSTEDGAMGGYCCPPGLQADSSWSGYC